jgi:hypothetical protein
MRSVNNAMASNWASVHAATVAIATLNESLPAVIVNLVVGYGQLSRVNVDAACKTISRQMLAWKPPSLRTCAIGNTGPTEKGQFSIGFVRGRDVMCTHAFSISNQDLWNFACGEAPPVIEAMIMLHTSDPAEMENCLRSARANLRNKMYSAIQTVELRAYWDKGVRHNG